MKVIADDTRCIGSGQCYLQAPGVFDIDDEEGTVVVLQEQPPVESERDVRAAAEICPSGAIKVLEI
ncbi:ferredoxin [Jatrophihabitans sp. GAS493]|uniref:ferredoxin n=1 Tax=Jatrophihabitans sp. GAS493 TaxID=1907575 RepID=UPI000BB78F49|nr:ferredoxin [Jatrophihabitans sp. GAS493]SOD71772.1 ferredoxin [Jatrophihabitans sp. GAS493]